MKKIITTEELSNVYLRVDLFLSRQFNIDLMEIMECEDSIEKKINYINYLINDNSLSDSSEYISMHELIDGLVDSLQLSYEEIMEVFYNSLYELSNKKIVRIEDSILRLSALPSRNIENTKTKTGVDFIGRIMANGRQLDIHSGISNKQLMSIIESLKNNMETFMTLYYDKIWLIESTIPQNKSGVKKVERISITPERLFHLLGFDFKAIDYTSQNNNFGNQSINYNQLLTLCGTSNRTLVNNLLNDFKTEEGNVKRGAEKWTPTKGKSLFELLILMIKNEQRLIEMLVDGKLDGIASIPKLMMKGYSFERLGIIEHSSGMIVFDKNIAKNNGFNDIRFANNLILLNDFIRRNQLDFVFSLYNNPYGINNRQSQSLVVSQNAGFGSSLLRGQIASISSSVAAYHPADFRYTIKLEDGSEVPSNPPISGTVKKFSDTDKLSMIKSLQKHFPSINTIELSKLSKTLETNPTTHDYRRM